MGPQIDATGHLVQGQTSHTWSALTPKASVSYQWTPELLQYFTYSRGFKSGGFDNRATRFDLAERPFNPEFVNTYETGLKSELFDHRLRTNLAAFYNEYTDLQVSFVDPAYPGNSIRGNAGRAHTEGVEAEFDAKPIERLSIQASAGYLFAVYDRYKNAGGLGVNADGHDLINAPRWTLSGAVGYDLPIHIVGGSFRIGADAQYASAAFSSALERPKDRYPDQAFFNANLTWTSDDAHWAAIVSGRNILDSQKPVSASNTPSTGVLYYNYPDPATVRFTLKYQY